MRIQTNAQLTENVSVRPLHLFTNGTTHCIQQTVPYSCNGVYIGAPGKERRLSFLDTRVPVVVQRYDNQCCIQWGHTIGKQG